MTGGVEQVGFQTKAEEIELNLMNTVQFTFTTLWGQIVLSYCSQKIGFGSSCKLSPEQIICIICQSIFSKKSTKKYFKMSSAKLLPSIQSVYLDLAGEIMISFTLIPYQSQFEPLR